MSPLTSVCGVSLVPDLGPSRSPQTQTPIGTDAAVSSPIGLPDKASCCFMIASTLIMVAPNSSAVFAGWHVRMCLRRARFMFAVRVRSGAWLAASPSSQLTSFILATTWKEGPAKVIMSSERRCIEQSLTSPVSPPNSSSMGAYPMYYFWTWAHPSHESTRSLAHSYPQVGD